MNTNYIIKSENIVLRPLREDDLEILRNIRNNKTISKYLNNIGEISKEQQIKWYANVLDRKNEIIFAIEDINIKRCVGSCSLYEIKEKEAKFGKIALDLITKNKGVGYKSILLSLIIGIQKYDIEKYYSEVYEDNVASMITHKKVGFEEIKSVNQNNMNLITLYINKDNILQKTKEIDYDIMEIRV